MNEVDQMLLFDDEFFLADSSRPWQVAFSLPPAPALVGAQLVLQSWTAPGDGDFELSRPVWLSLDTW